MKNLRSYLVYFLVCAGMVMFNSCSEKLVDPEVVIENSLDLPFEVSVENGVLNFETKTDYELALNYLVELELKGELDQFENSLVFESYRTAFKNNKEKMDAIQDDVLASFLNPQQQVVIENKLFEVSLTEDRVSVWEYQGCELKSVSYEILIGQFKCDDDIFEKLEGVPSLKSSDYCEGNHEGFNVPITYGNNYHNVFEVDVDYIKAGLYYTLNARIRQSGDNQTKIGLRTDNCSYTKKDGSNYTYSKDESGFDWERNFRPYWGLQRLKAYTFEVDFYYFWNLNTEYSIATVNNQCQY